MIIHIAGASGSGKTYIGNLFIDRMNVIDLDNWTEEFNKKKLKTNKKFITFIDDKINKLDQNKINLLVGYLDVYINNKLIIYPLKTNFKFFIKISPQKLFIQYNMRLVNYICKNKNNIILNIKKNILPPSCKNMEDLHKEYTVDYKNYVTNLNYTLYSSTQIINFIKHIK
jgi:ABC-type dipeptide/oligopeptide/nickel transport system ATPase subunit